MADWPWLGRGVLNSPFATNSLPSWRQQEQLGASPSIYNPGDLNHEVWEECKELPADVSAMQHSFPRLLLVSDRYLQIHIKHINL